MRLRVSLSLTVTLAVAGLAFAQESGCLLLKKISASRHALQHRSDIELSVTLVTAHCSIPVEIKPGKLTDFSLQPQEGFEVYRPVVETNGFDKASVTGSTWMAQAMTARFTLHAFREASVGEHTIPATLTYRAQDTNGNVASHRLALSIPVKVIAPPKASFWDEHPEARKTLVTTVEVLLAIVAIPVLILGNILGFYRWDC